MLEYGGTVTKRKVTQTRTEVEMRALIQGLEMAVGKEGKQGITLSGGR